MNNDVKLDEKDRKIIEFLKEDSRTPYKEIAKKIGISDVSVKKRIEKLIQNGIIKKFTIEFDLKKPYKILLLIKGEPKQKKGFQKIVGEYDYFGIFEFDSFEDYQKFIRKIENKDLKCYPQIFWKE